MNTHCYRKNKRGFTIIETFVAVVLFTLAISATLSLVSKGLFFSSTSADRITAVYLAQEGLEFVRNARSSNLLAGSTWLNGLDVCNTATNANGCYIDTPLRNDNLATRVKACSATCLPLDYNATLFTYGYTSPLPNPPNPPWTRTTFRRGITIKNITTDEVLVTVTVTWSQKNLTQSLTLKDHFFNWQ